MTHAQALNTRDTGPNGGDNATCDGTLIDPQYAFHSDVAWTKFLCSKCGKIIYTVGGGRHWWNYDRDVNVESLTNPAEAE